jgi:hypothetical protein
MSDILETISTERKLLIRYRNLLEVRIRDIELQLSIANEELAYLSGEIEILRGQELEEMLKDDSC